MKVYSTPKALPPALENSDSRCPVFVWVCALAWSAFSGLLVLEDFFGYCFAHGLGHGVMGFISPAQAIGFLADYLLSLPGSAALLASIPAAFIGAAVYSIRSIRR